MAAGDVEVDLTNPLAKRGAYFDGVDDYVEISHDSSQLGANLSNGFTISVWINPKSAGENGGRILVKSDAATGAINGFQFRMNVVNLAFGMQGGVEKSSAANSTPFGTWTHAIITVSSLGLFNFYINGILSNTADQDGGSPTSVITSTNDLIIGNRNGGTDRTFDGSIKDVKMWNRVLTTTEITQDYAGKRIINGLILDVPLQNDYNDIALGLTGTNSGSVFKTIDDQVATAVADARTTANDKYLITLVNSKVLTSVIEEA